MVEDPMVYIKQKENETRDNAYSDPMMIQKLK